MLESILSSPNATMQLCVVASIINFFLFWKAEGDIKYVWLGFSFLDLAIAVFLHLIVSGELIV